MCNRVRPANITTHLKEEELKVLKIIGEMLLYLFAIIGVGLTMAMIHAIYEAKCRYKYRKKRGKNER